MTHHDTCPTRIKNYSNAFNHTYVEKLLFNFLFLHNWSSHFYIHC